MRWFKSTYSSDQGNCVEVAEISGGAAVRDGKDPGGPMLRFSSAQWVSFSDAISRGDFG
ncbi:MAG: DUF397 domain-containing protein [Pseudonocardiales bacterium]